MLGKRRRRRPIPPIQTMPLEQIYSMFNLLEGDDNALSVALGYLSVMGMNMDFGGISRESDLFQRNLSQIRADLRRRATMPIIYVNYPSGANLVLRTCSSNMYTAKGDVPAIKMEGTHSSHSHFTKAGYITGWYTRQELLDEMYRRQRVNKWRRRKHLVMGTAAIALLLLGAVFTVLLVTGTIHF